MGVAATLSFFTLAYVQLEKHPAAIETPAPLPDSVAPMALSTSWTTQTPPVTTVEVPVPTTTVPQPVPVTTRPPAPPVPTPTTVPAPVTTTEEPEPDPVQTPVVWTKALAKQYARELVGAEVFEGCTEPHLQKESGWDWMVYNFQGSGAYGLPQALPGSKMASAGADWKTNPATQLRWYLRYVNEVYGGPCAAWEHFKVVGSY